MISLENKKYRIDIIDESVYTVKSFDYDFQYDKIHLGSEIQDYKPYAQYGVMVYINDVLLKSALVMASGGVTSIHNVSAVMDDDRLLMCCGNHILCMKIEDLDLLWNQQADSATCLEIFNIKGGYIVHGEIAITRLDRDGQKLWSTCGADIFLTKEGEGGCEVTEDSILVTDWNNDHYTIDFEGRIVNDTVKRK